MKDMDNIVGQLMHCRAMLDAIVMAMGDEPLVDAIAGVGDLIDGINRDLEPYLSLNLPKITNEKGEFNDT